MERKKKELRALFIKKREGILNRESKTSRLNRKLINFLQSKITNESISSYLPVRNEIDLSATSDFLIKNKYSVCLPEIVGENKRLVFKFWNKNVTLIPGKYNIPIPDTTEIIEPNILLIPLLAFDLNKIRLGYGGGYYDRTLESLRMRKNILSIGVGFDEQRTNNMAYEEHDQKLDFILTPTKVIS